MRSSTSRIRPKSESRSEELTEEGILSSDSATQVRVKGKKLRMLRLRADAEDPGTVTVKQQQVLTALKEFGDVAEKELCYICGVGPL